MTEKSSSGSQDAKNSSGETSEQAVIFDPAEFMQFVQDQNLSDEDAHMLLAQVWSIVLAFVKVGFGQHPVQHARDKIQLEEKMTLAASSAVLSFKDQFSKATRQKPAPRPARRARRRKDS